MEKESERPEMNWGALDRVFTWLLEAAEQSPEWTPQIVYVFGQTPDNQISGIRRAARFPRTTRIAYPSDRGVTDQGLTHSGVADRAVWEAEMAEAGISHEQIVRIPIHAWKNGKFVANTGDDARECIAYCKEHGIADLVITTPKFHLLRCWLTTLRQMEIQNCLHMRVHPVFGDNLPWDDDVLHSQGKLGGCRWELCFREAFKLAPYLKGGFIADPVTALRYVGLR